MADHIEKGRTGEKIALDYLESKGFNILETNWFFRHKEIDIIAENSDIIVFIEVKTRGISSLKKARECVGYKKEVNIIEAANQYIIANNIHKEARFDIIAIDFLNNSKYTLEHIESAFFPRI